MELATKRKIKLKELRSQDIIKIAPVVIRVLAPNLPLLDESPVNNNSLVLQLTYNDFKLLLTGDLEVEGEERLLANCFNLNTTVLKVAHHGSNTSTSKEFIRKIRPHLAVVSVGTNNYGHPSSKVIKNLQIRDIKVLRTDQQGAITLETDGYQYRYRSYIK